MRLLFGTLIISFLFIGYLLFKIQPSIPVVKAVPAPTITVPPYIPDDADDLFQTVNEWRIKEGYQPYKKSEVACSFALKRLPQVKTDWEAGHKGFYELAKSYPSNTYWGENLAKGFIFTDRTLNGWLNSPLHRENLEKPFTHSCIKCDSGFCVQIFSYF